MLFLFCFLYQSISINLFSQLCNNKNECQQNNVKHSVRLPEKQIAPLVNHLGDTGGSVNFSSEVCDDYFALCISKLTDDVSKIKRIIYDSFLRRSL